MGACQFVPAVVDALMLSRAHRLGTRHHRHLWSCSSFYSTTTSLDVASNSTNHPSPTPALESGSHAAIVSLLHQHIAFRTRPWELAKKQKEQTTRNAGHRESAYPLSAPGFVKPLQGRSTSVGLPLKRRPRIPTSTTADLEALADGLEAYAMTQTTSFPEPLLLIYHRQSLRTRLLTILAHTQDAAHAWAAYRSLLILPRSAEKSAPKVPFAHRHRLLRLLAAVPPRSLHTRGRYAQVLSVVRALQEAGGIVQRWEWNLLLDCAGKEGWRHPREEHFRAALAILDEMRALGGDGDPGSAGATMTAMGTNASKNAKPRSDGNSAGAGPAPTPDIYSYTILLAHAVRSRAPMAVRHAARLLLRAGLTPGVHAHTALLCFFARRGDLAGVRDTLFRLRRHMQDEDDDNGDSGSDGSDSGLTQASFNAVLWAFAYNRRLDIARAMYRIVRARADIAAENGRHRSPSEVLEEREELEELEALTEREMIVIARDVVPDAVTYHTLIQAYAYQGDLRGCLETLSDMLSAPASSLYHYRDERQAKEKGEEGKEEGQRRRFTASLTAFRAIFLGFARHGVDAASSPAPTITTTHTIHEDEEKEDLQWALPALEALFARFLDLPHDTPLREPTLFWLVSAFSRMSGHQDSDSDSNSDSESSLLLRSVFERVEARFGSSALRLTLGDDGERRGRLARIREKVFSGSL
jgi:pentatricopeptide repeat protein